MQKQDTDCRDAFVGGVLFAAFLMVSAAGTVTIMELLYTGSLTAALTTVGGPMLSTVVPVLVLAVLAYLATYKYPLMTVMRR